MTATVVKLRQRPRLECPDCGATCTAGCECGVPYVLAGARAAEAVAKNPEKSDRAIAADIGVSTPTVSRARKSGVTSVTPEKRVGKDGKSYPAKRASSATPKPHKPKAKAAARASDPVYEECADCDSPEQHWQRSLGNLAGDAVSMRAFWKREFGKWEKFEVPSSLVTLAKQAAQAWAQLAADLSKR